LAKLLTFASSSISLSDQPCNQLLKADKMNQNEEIVSENSESAENVAASPETAGSSEDSQVSEVQKLQAEIAEQKDKFIRLYSEFENFRRRTAKEKLEMIQSANEQLIKTLLPVADDFERAEKSFKAKDDKDLRDFFLIYNKFKKTLDQAGVKVMELKPGSEFDADLHEAITQIPVDGRRVKRKDCRRC
jgi:molecular chaperone GrpE